MGGCLALSAACHSQYSELSLPLNTQSCFSHFIFQRLHVVSHVHYKIIAIAIKRSYRDLSKYRTYRPGLQAAMDGVRALICWNMWLRETLLKALEKSRTQQSSGRMLWFSRVRLTECTIGSQPPFTPTPSCKCLEDAGILDPSNDADLFALHYVYLPRLQHQLNTFRESYSQHRIRGQRNRSPYQLWIEGMANLNSDESAIIGAMGTPLR